MVIIHSIGRNRDANARCFDGEGEEGTEFRGNGGGGGPLRRVGRKVVQMAISIGAKCSNASDATRCKYYYLYWYDY